MAIAATWVISTARSPTTWQPRIRPLVRSTTSLQKPAVRPSMIVRVVESKRTTAVTTSNPSRAFASVRPTPGILRIGEAAGWLGHSPQGHRWPAARRWWPRRSLPVSPGGPRAGGPVMSPAAKMWGTDVRRCASTVTNPRLSVLTPTLSRPRSAVLATQPTATIATAASTLSRTPSFETIMRIPPGAFSNASTAPKSLAHHDACFPESSGHRGRHILVFGAQDAWAGLEQMDPAAEGVEDRRDLRAGRAGADDQHRRGNRGQLPGVAVRGRQLGPGHGQRSADAPGADDDLVGVQAQARIGHDGVRVGEMCRSRPFVHGDAQLVYLRRAAQSAC